MNQPLVATLIAVELFISSGQRCMADETTIDRFELANGIRVLSVHVPEAAKQSTFTFLPLSLATDPKNRAQWSHLLEHMLIRSTDPHDLFPEGMQINGETGADYLRLDSYADPSHWKESIQRHAAWLTARDFDAATLEREKVNIAGEERGTTMSGFTHKWAIAAWNQVARHGADQVLVHGDVANAVVEDVEGVARGSISIDDSILIATIGPADPTAVREMLEVTVGAIAPQRRAAIDQPERVEQSTGDVEASWDLPTHHLLMWWLVPDETLAERAAVRAFGQLLGANLFRQVSTLDRDALALVHDSVRTPEGTRLIINIRTSPDADTVKLHEVVRRQIDALVKNTALVKRVGPTIARNVDLPTDFGPLRQRLAARGTDLLEAHYLLQAAQAEFVLGATYEEIAVALKELDEDALARVVEVMSKPSLGELTLVPGSQDD